jgi:hypothetical protein
VAESCLLNTRYGAERMRKQSHDTTLNWAAALWSTFAGCSQIMLALLLIAAVGCDREIETSYATIRGNSINGIAAFVQLLRDTDHTVVARQQLPAEIEVDVNTLVVFDDSFQSLRPAAADLLSRFLEEDSGRTLLLVLRDSDCMVAYLQSILADAALPPDRRARAEEMLADAEDQLASAVSQPRAATEPFADRLIKASRKQPSAGRILVGVRQRQDGSTTTVDARWQLQRRLEASRGSRVLWFADSEPLLATKTIGDSTVHVLASAAPVLNGGLVDPGNRQLAEDLVNRLPTDGKMLVAGSTAVALPNGSGKTGGGTASDSGQEPPSPWRLLAVQPLPWVAAQALAAMALFCWCTAPILGRPRQSSPTHVQDFGHHVDALANLLRKSASDGERFSLQRLAAWREVSPTPTSRLHRRSRT